MKKTLTLGVTFFLLGLGSAALVVFNPTQSGWIEALQHRAGLPHGGAPAGGVESGLWTCSMHPQVLSEEPGFCPICQMALTPVRDSAAPSRSGAERKIKYWKAPMDPGYISDRPGKSPMGMDLVPVYEDEVESVPGMVRIDPQFVQTIGVRSEPARRTDIPNVIRTVGYLVYNDEQIQVVTPKYEGWIEKSFVNYVGQPVAKGRPLFEIYSPQLVTTQKEYLQAVEYVERLSLSDYPEIVQRAKSLLESTRERLSYWDISEEQIHALEKDRKVRRTLTVTSEASGLVVSKMEQGLEGMYVKPGMNLLKIVDLSTIWLEVEVFEDQLSSLAVGQKASVDFPSLPDRSVTARVRFIYPYFNEKTRALKLSLELPNPGQKLRAGMYANVSFEVPAARGVVAVPESAVLHGGLRDLVVVDLGDGTFQVREVRTGVSGNGLTEIREGVREDDRVVVSSQFLIDSESNLREAVRLLSTNRDGLER